MTANCPGQDFRKLTVETLRCPQCRAEIEIFSDEARVRCHKCGATVHRDKMPSCIEWCAAARRCVGEESWRSLKGQDEEELKDGSS